MARKKKYREEEVIDKAMKLFWRNGYHTTSMQMLEKEMGINKFSIYSSFGSKHGVFVESLKSYKKKVQHIMKAFHESNKGLEDIKTFFYDSVEICHQPGNEKGCLVTNTYYEFSELDDAVVTKDMNDFMKNLKTLFVEKLKQDGSKDMATVQQQANYLLLAKHGLAAATRVNTREEIEDYIELTFSRL